MVRNPRHKKAAAGGTSWIMAMPLSRGLSAGIDDPITNKTTLQPNRMPDLSKKGVNNFGAYRSL
jgi:hypothetical protein